MPGAGGPRGAGAEAAGWGTPGAAEAFRRADRTVAELYARYDGLLGHERRPFVPTPERFEALLGDVRAASGAAGRLTALEGTAASAAAANIREVLDAFEARVRSDRTFPDRFVSQIARRATALLRLDPRSDAERAEVLAPLAAQWVPIAGAAADGAMRLPRDRREMTSRALAALGAFLERLDRESLGAALPSAPAGAVSAVDEGLRAAGAAVREAADRVAGAGDPAGTVPDGLGYAETLRGVYGIELGDLVDMHRGEVERCRARLQAAASKLDQRRDAFQILDEDLGAYGSAEEMYAAMRGYVALARERSLEFVTLPDGETCEVWRVPDYLKDAYPWGGYFALGSALAGQPRGAVFLNADNYRTVTRGWVQLNAIHECYPGHHAQFAKTAAGDMPLSFKVGTVTSRAAALSEGIAVRTETLMQRIFDAPAFPLFAAYRRLHTALRIWVDLVLHHFGRPRPVEEAVALYGEYMRFPPHVARGQVYAQQLSPGYFATYYYGVTALERIQASCGWDDRRFSELIFSCGKVSLRILERLLALPEAARRALLQSYSALGS